MIVPAPSSTTEIVTFNGESVTALNMEARTIKYIGPEISDTALLLAVGPASVSGCLESFTGSVR